MQGKLIVVEGSKGKTVAFSTPEINDVVFDTVTRKSLDNWTERLEIWIPVPSKNRSHSMRGSQSVLQQIEMANFHFKLVLKPNTKIAFFKFFFQCFDLIKDSSAN